MKNLCALIIVACLTVCGAAEGSGEVRFAALDIYLQTSTPVAAWQFELNSRHGKMQVVGVEGGDSAAFRRAPYYDREAVQLGEADRLVVADYSLASVDELPSGRFRIATIHVMTSGVIDDIELTLITATAHDGTVIKATISHAGQTGSEQ